MGIQQAHPVDALISVIFTGNVQCCGHGEERRRDDDFGGYAAAVAEVDHQDLWQRAALGVAVVSGERRHVGEMLQSVRRLVEATHGAELLDWQEQTQ